jgi:hypothetical protein
MVPIMEAEIKSVLVSTTKKSSGCDEVTSKILKTVSSVSYPLSYFYNHLLYTGIFPDQLKFWLDGKPSAFLLSGLQKLKQRAKKCSKLRGEYVK